MYWATMRTRSRIWSDCLERVHTHGVFVKNRITTPKKEKEKEKKRAKRLKELLVYLFRNFDAL